MGRVVTTGTLRQPNSLFTRGVVPCVFALLAACSGKDNGPQAQAATHTAAVPGDMVLGCLFCT